VPAILLCLDALSNDWDPFQTTSLDGGEAKAWVFPSALPNVEFFRFLAI
jgi:hypothetical protein